VTIFCPEPDPYAKSNNSKLQRRLIVNTVSEIQQKQLSDSSKRSNSKLSDRSIN